MLFNSWQFVAFAIIVFAAYFGLRRLRWQNAMLLVASYVFYGAWDWRFLSLIAISTVVDFIVGQRLGKSSDEAARRRLLATSVVVNLGILGVFKYFNFFADSLQALLGGVGWQVDAITLEVVLPVGISFYTFQTLSYTIDIYRRKLEPTSDFVDFALFVAFFPQLVAGPIERASHLLPQIQRARTVTSRDVNVAIYLILWGFVLKMAIADNAARIVNEVFGNHGDYGGLDVVVASLAFAIQIYGDFAGYSKIARGVARLLGFDLMVNFRIPYAALTPSDFWQRWHISLSTWLRDYLYISLGGNREGAARTYRNLSITMLLGGLWHGAAWNFVLWGAYHGLLLILYRAVPALRGLLKPSPGALGVLRRGAAWGAMLGFTLYGWLLFRATSMTQIVEMTTGIFTGESVAAGALARDLVWYAWPLVLVDLLQHQSRDLLVLTKLSWPVQGAVYGFMAIWLLLFGVREPVEFIYFAF